MGYQYLSTKKMLQHYFKWGFWNIIWYLLVIIAILIGMVILYFYDNRSPLESSYHLIKGLPVILSIAIIPMNLIYFGYRTSIMRDQFRHHSFSCVKMWGVSLLSTFIWNMAIYALVVIIACILMRDNLFLMRSILFGQLTYALLLLHLTCYGLMLMLNICIINGKIILWISSILCIVSLILSGQLVPYYLYPRTDILAYFNLAMPLNYAIGLINNTLMMPDMIEKATNNVTILGVQNIYELLNSSLTPQFYEKIIYNKYGIDIFNIYSDFKITENQKNLIIFNHWNKVLNLIIPWLISSVAFGISYYFADKTFICYK